MNNKPTQEYRLGNIKATIWKNETSAGPRYNTNFKRIFKDGDQWKQSDSFGREELLVLAKLADQVHTWDSSTEYVDWDRGLK